MTHIGFVVFYNAGPVTTFQQSSICCLSIVTKTADDFNKQINTIFFSVVFFLNILHRNLIVENGI